MKETVPLSSIADLIPVSQADADLLLGRLFPTRNQRLAAEELNRPSCGRCGIPRSEYSGHWCNDGVTELWLGWAS